MPRMTPEEFEADLARARAEGAGEIARMVRSMTDLGLPLAAVAGALGGLVEEMVATADAAKVKADESRKSKPAGEPEE